MLTLPQVTTAMWYGCFPMPSTHISAQLEHSLQLHRHARGEATDSCNSVPCGRMMAGRKGTCLHDNVVTASYISALR